MDMEIGKGFGARGVQEAAQRMEVHWFPQPHSTKSR